MPADIATRLRRLDADLRTLASAYSKAHNTWSSAGSPLRSPVYDRRRSGKPSSSTPPEAEGRTRMLLVLCAQRLAMSLRVLAKHDWLDSQAWHPQSLQRQHVIVRDPRTEIPSFTIDGDPAWRDPEDVTVLPVDITPGVSQLRGVISSLCAVDWDKQDEADQDTVRDMLHEAEQSVRAVKSTGAWPSAPPKDTTPKVCNRKGCWNEVVNRDGGVCGACVARDYRERKKAS